MALVFRVPARPASSTVATPYVNVMGVRAIYAQAHFHETDFL